MKKPAKITNVLPKSFKNGKKLQKKHNIQKYQILYGKNSKNKTQFHQQKQKQQKPQTHTKIQKTYQIL